MHIRNPLTLALAALLFGACIQQEQDSDAHDHVAVAVQAVRAGDDTGRHKKVKCAVANQKPFPEVCNAFDDDCDGQLDEGVCSDPCDQPW